MRTNKVSCFVVLFFALIFAVAGTVMLLLPEPTSPVTVTGTPSVKSSNGYIELYFTLKNESDEDVKITYLEVNVSTNSGSEKAFDRDSLIIKAGGTEKCEYYFQSYSRPTGITEITVRINGKEYYAYGSNSSLETAAVIFFILAILFAILSMLNFVSLAKQKKRYKSINKEIEEKFAGNAIFAVGYCSKQGEAGKAAAKTAASVAGGAIFAGLFGFGAFKTYGANAAKEYVVSNEGLFVGNPLKKGFNLGGMNYFAKGSLPETEITVKKKRVTLTNRLSGEYFVFDLSGNKSVTTEQLVEKLNNLLVPSEVISQSSAAAGNNEAAAIKEDDPFDI